MQGANWYVSTGGAPIGPLSEHQVIEMLRSGMKATGVARDGEQWWDPRQYAPFYQAMFPGGLPAQPVKKKIVWPYAIGIFFALAAFGVCSSVASRTPSVATSTATATATTAPCPNGGTRRGRGEVKSACEDLVKKQLLSPKSADFPGIFDSNGAPEELGECRVRWRAYVDAKNAFGVEVRRTFTCDFDPQADRVRAVIDPL